MNVVSAAKVIFPFYMCVIFAQHIDNEPNDNASDSLDSRSDEAFNFTVKGTPVRERTVDAIGEEHKTGTRRKHGLANYQYSVSIQKRNSHYASGALVHKKWILSVAREFYNVRESIKLFRARLGTVNCKRGGSLFPLKEIEIHPLYVYNEPIHDLAMLRISQPVACSEYIKPIILSNKEGSIVSAKFLSTYWPRLIVNGKILSDSAKERLKQNSMRVSIQSAIPWERCYDIMQSYNYTLERSSQCLEPIVSQHSLCMPDVGAPIIADDGLWGITSGWTPEDCLLEGGSPTIFTRISIEPTKSWMDMIMGITNP